MFTIQKYPILQYMTLFLVWITMLSTNPQMS